MFKLIKYDNANALEATWLRELTPEITTPEVLDEDGNVTEPSKVTPATYEQIASIAYHETQIDLLRADVAKYGGDLTEYESLIAEVEANIRAPESLREIPPTSVTMVQARLALVDEGLLDKVEDSLNSIALDNQRKRALIEWEFSTIVNRDSALVVSLANNLGLSNEDLDSLFLKASKL